MTKNKTDSKIITWKQETRKLSDLKPHADNPRTFTDKGLKDLEQSINSVGFMQPININQDGTILSGHARVETLKKMGRVEVDVYSPDRVLTPKQEKEVLIRLNKNTAGEWDLAKLNSEFELEDLLDYGFEETELEMDEEEEKDFSGKNEEISDLDGESTLKLKFTAEDYLEALDRMNGVRDGESNEELFFKMLAHYEKKK